MSIAARANKVCKSIKKPMSIPSKTRKDQKAHEHSSNPCEKRLKPMKIATNGTTENRPPAEENSTGFSPALRNTPLSHAHTASPHPLARTHDTNTKRNRNRFPDWGSPASINSPQSPIKHSQKEISWWMIKLSLTQNSKTKLHIHSLIRVHGKIPNLHIAIWTFPEDVCPNIIMIFRH